MVKENLVSAESIHENTLNKNRIKQQNGKNSGPSWAFQNEFLK